MILGAMDSPDHWLVLVPGPEIYIGSLAGNGFRWYPGRSAGLREQTPCVVSK